jgi:two-component system, NarL family, invasion response regulator UvrY
MIRILAADDHPIFRNGIRHIIEEESGLVLEDEASSGKEVFKLLAKKTYDILVLDIEMPDMNGLEVLKQVKLLYPTLPVLILSFYSEEQYAFRALKLGASGYLTKESAAANLVLAVEKIVSGKKYITDNVAQYLSEHFDKSADGDPHLQLSDREYQVFFMIAEGRPAVEISSILNLSPKTISTYKKRICEKLNLQNDAQIVRYAMQKGIIH